MPRRRRYRPNWPLTLSVAALVLVVTGYILSSLWPIGVKPGRFASRYDPTMMLIARSLDTVLALWFLSVGASIGSFLNVVVYRLPIGRTLNGHSSCPYCRVPIHAADNIPVFAWLRLRGRCRACRLPISFQYPAVELLVGILFLIVYFAEFAGGGSNLPGGTGGGVRSGLINTDVSPKLLVRTLILLSGLSCLTAAGLMVIRSSRVAPSILIFTILVSLAAAGALPETTILNWRVGTGIAPIEKHLDAIATVLSGGLAGLLIGLITGPTLYSGAKRLQAGDKLSWSVTCAAVGALFGWQTFPIVLGAVASLAIAATLGFRSLGRRAAGCDWSSDPIVWAWAGVLLVRCNWRTLEALTVREPGVDAVLHYVFTCCVAMVLTAAAGVLRAILWKPIDLPVVPIDAAVLPSSENIGLSENTDEVVIR
ncbi:MAG: prepilin peptidase [Pirellulales bacterium]